MPKLGPPPIDVDPTPMTREGTHALVERFYAMNPHLRQKWVSPYRKQYAPKTQLGKSSIYRRPQNIREPFQKALKIRPEVVV